MMLLKKPTLEQVRSFLARQASSDYSYSAVGATSRDEIPSGYDLDHNRILLGQGRAVFEAACAALRGWQQFPHPWTQIVPHDTPIRAGQPVAMIARAFGFWWLNAARIVHLIDRGNPQRYFGYAYGTLPAHVEQGEERFLVEWLADDSVWYDLRAFSRPRHLFVRLAYPLARRLQRKFARESMQTMKRLATQLPSRVSVS